MKFHYRLAVLVIRLTAKVLFGWKVKGVENIPDDGALIASNHFSLCDPPLIGSAIKREIFFFAKYELFRNKLFGAMLKSVNAFPARRGEVDRQAWKRSKSLLESGELLLFFPEGGRSKDGQLKPAKPGMARLAVATGKPVIPTVISGSNCLKDVFLRRSKLRVGFSNPVMVSEFNNLESKQLRCSKLTDRVMNEIQRLKIEVQNI